MLVLLIATFATLILGLQTIMVVCLFFLIREIVTCVTIILCHHLKPKQLTEVWGLW